MNRCKIQSTLCDVLCEAVQGCIRSVGTCRCFRWQQAVWTWVRQNMGKFGSMSHKLEATAKAAAATAAGAARGVVGSEVMGLVETVRVVLG